MRELSQCFAFCRFCDFSIYISVRFIYISVTHLCACFFLFLLAQIHAPPFLPCHPCHLWQVIDSKRFFLVMSVAKTCHAWHENPKPLILKGFFIDTRVMSLVYNALYWIVITSYCLCAALRCVIIHTSTKQATSKSFKKFWKLLDKLKSSVIM